MEYAPTASTLALVQRLGGIWHGQYAMVRCPAHDDHDPSLSIRQGRETILVHCFAGCDGASVMRAIRNITGDAMSRVPAMPLPANDHVPPFRRLWNQAGPIAGTLAHRYLREVRGIHFLPPDVRFLARCPMGKGTAASFHPALLVGVFRSSTLIAIQRLFLDPTTAERTGRMMLGASRGGTWPAQFSGSVLRLAEGFETACAYQQFAGREAGTCFGARNFMGVRLDAGTASVTLLPDNDEEGSRAAQVAVNQRHSTAIPFDIERCPDGIKDWADLVRPLRFEPAA